MLTKLVLQHNYVCSPDFSWIDREYFGLGSVGYCRHESNRLRIPRVKSSYSNNRSNKTYFCALLLPSGGSGEEVARGTPSEVMGACVADTLCSTFACPDKVWIIRIVY